MVWLGIPIAIVAAIVCSLVTIPAWDIAHEFILANASDADTPPVIAFRHFLDAALLVVWVLLPGLIAFGGWLTLLKKMGMSNH